MSSDVDATVPADNVKADKSLFRQNFQIIKEEIEALQSKVSVPGSLAYSDIGFDNL